MMNSRQVWPDIWNLVLHRFHQEQNQPKMSERESLRIFLKMSRKVVEGEAVQLVTDKFLDYLP